MKTKWLSRVAGCAAGVMSILPLAASAGVNLVNDPDFSQVAVSGSFTTYGVGTMGGWTVSAGSVDLIGNYWQAPPGGGQSVDMSGNQNGTISQSITLGAGTYKLTFAESGNPDGPPSLKQLLVGLGGAPAQEFDYTIGANGRGNMQWITQTAYFTVSGGNGLLQFQDISSGAGFNNPVGPVGTTPWGAVIGNVSLTAVPEPTTVVAGVGALGLVLASMARPRRSSVARIGK
jgi:choice-of-anchor C domain-containing protein